MLVYERDGILKVLYAKDKPEVYVWHMVASSAFDVTEKPSF